MRIILLVFLLLLSSPAKAENCFPQDELNDRLLKGGFLLHEYGMTDKGFLFKLYIGPETFVLTLSDEDIACIAMTGANVYTPRRIDI